MLNIQGSPSRSCAGFNRRTMLQAAGAGLMGLNVNNILAAESLGGSQALRPRARSVIFLFLFGGPSQYETFDMKPNAPEKIRGPFKPIASANPELIISEHLPHLARRADQFSVIRTMTHTFNDHSGGGHYMQTGHRWQVPQGGGFAATPQDWPSMGAVTQWHAEQTGLNSGLPASAVLPNWLGRLQAEVCEHLPGKPFSRDNWRSLQADSVVRGEDGLAQLGIVPTLLTSIVPALLAPARRAKDHAWHRRHAHR